MMDMNGTVHQHKKNMNSHPHKTDCKPLKRIHPYTLHTLSVYANVVVFHFHVLFFIVIAIAVVLCSLARSVCVQFAFVIFSLNVHFICLEIKNNLIIYRINIHIELC